MKPLPNPRAGEIWDVKFSPQQGHEQWGIRPALVISNNEFNDLPHTFRIVVPLTGTDRRVDSHVRIDAPLGGLAKTSFILCEQAKSQGLERFRHRRGELAGDTVEVVRRIVGRFIDAHRVFR